jgi:DNA-binding NarL/FixJ family response regulator
MTTPPDEDRIRLLLLDEHGLFRTSLGRLLAAEPGLEVTGECGTSAEALGVLQASTVDIVLLDFDVGPEQANDFISAAREARYEGRFLIVAGEIDVERSASAFKLGASGVFLKSDVPEHLIQAIRVVSNGAVWVDQKIIQVFANQYLVQPHHGNETSGMWLKDREMRVLQGILVGLTNRKIADGMGTSESCVKNILQALFSRTGVRTRSQLVRLALEGSLGKVDNLTKFSANIRTRTIASSQSKEPHDATPAGRLSSG